MKKATRLALAVAMLAVPAGATPIAGNKGPVQVHAPALARLHIKSFTIVSPTCGKQAELRAEVQNLTGTPFAGSTGLGGPTTYLFSVTAIGKPAPNVWQQALPGVGAGATISVLVNAPTFTTPCPSDTCWEAGLVRSASGAESKLPEWDGKAARICAKTSCNPHASRRRTPCTFELYSPGPR